MYGLTSDLVAAQSAQSPTYSVSVTVGAVAPGGGAQGEAWQTMDAFPDDLSTWAPQGIAQDAAASVEGLMRLFLSHSDGLLACQWCSGSDASSATFTAAPVATIASFTPTAGIYTPKPALVHEGGRWHAYYRLPDGNIYHRQSSNNGGSWSAAGTVYGGGSATGDLFALHLSTDNLHVVQFATSTDHVRMAGAARAGSGTWQTWSTHASTTGWLPAGMAAIATNQVRGFWEAATPPPRRYYLGTIDCTVATDGTLASRSADVATLRVVAGESPVRPTRYAVGAGFGATWYTAQLIAATRDYLVAGRLDIGTSTLAATVGEGLPVRLTPLASVPLESHTTPCDRGDRTLLVGLAHIHRSAHRNVSIVSEADAVISYRYVVSRNQAGTLNLVLRRHSALAATIPGDVLSLTRTCRKGTDSGSVALGFVVQRVEISPENVRFTAVDALGTLTESLTPFAIEGGTIDDTQALRALCAWGGVASEIALASVESAPSFHWRAGERGSVALLRYLRRIPVRVRSRVAGVGEYPRVRIDDDTESVEYEYGEGNHPLIHQVRIADARETEVIAVRGAAIRNQPEAGEDWALASRLSTRVPGQRGTVVSLEDRHLEPNEIADIANALANRGLHVVTCQIVTQANLALEVHDWVKVAGESCVTDAIVETWAQGRLLQHVDLCRNA